MNSWMLRDLAAIGFRQKRVIGISFVCIFSAIAVLLSLQPNVYDTEMKLLVKQSRIDPLVTPDPQLPQRVGNLTEQDLTSEAELLKSRDVLEGAALQCTRQKKTTTLWSFVPVVNAFAGTPSKQPVDFVAASQAERELEQNVHVAPLKNSNVISVTYSSDNPTRAVCTLKTIGKLYLEKHLAVHRPSGAFQFFKQEAEQYKHELDGIEAQLASFGQQEQLVTEGVEKEIGVRKLGDYEAALLDTKTAIAETQARIRKLEALSKTTAPRTVKAVRTAPNEALKELQAQLATLELKHTEMLGKFAPTYKPVQELEKQIQGLKNTIADLQKNPSVEQTTDTNPANDWVKLELAKARSELAALQASTSAKEHAVQEYRSMVLDLDQKNIRRTDLIRTEKTAEEKYLLYLRKQEEARIEEELDRQRILNVAVAQEPAVPVLPEPSPIPIKFGFVLAALLGLGTGFVTDYNDRSLRTASEVEKYLGIPVLASVPLIGDADPQREAHTL